MSSDSPLAEVYRKSRDNANIVSLFVDDNDWKDYRTIAEKSGIEKKTHVDYSIKELKLYGVLVEKTGQSIVETDASLRLTKKFKIADQYESELKNYSSEIAA